MSIASPAGAQTPPAAFDRLLSGITECKFSAEFDELRRGVIERFANPAGTTNPTVNRTVTVPLPATLAPYIDIDGATVKGDASGESTSVSIPVRGSFNGVPLQNLQFGLGNENGISVVGVEFAVPRDVVVAKFNKAIQRGSALLKRSSDGIEMTVGFTKPPMAAIYCDQSN